jgi:hypothetical protein
MELVERQRARSPTSTRLAALEQLLRIEYDGAYVGMVGGSPGVGEALSGRYSTSCSHTVGVHQEKRSITYYAGTLAL